MLDANFGIFEHIVFSIWARPGRGRGLAASSNTSIIGVNSKWFKYQNKKVELCLCYIYIVLDNTVLQHQHLMEAI